jgi:hypothetical protein
MEPGKYSLEIVAKSGDRVLTTLTYPNQSYADLVSAEVVLMNALGKAGISYAEAKGEEIPDQVKALLGIGPNPGRKE